jgi:signal transduction histidine kinase
MIFLQANNRVLFIIAITTAMLLVIAFFSIYLLLLFQKRKMRLLQQQQKMKEEFEQEILKTQIEIRDQAMNDVGSELHDHVSQVMALIKLNMNLLSGKGLDAADEKRLLETKGMVHETINDIRLLSKTLNGDLILQIGLIESIRHELERINRLNIIQCQLEVQGKEYYILPNTAFIVFRIIQENLHNILKHARCKNVITNLTFTGSGIILTQKDDGIGFNPEKAGNISAGSGLINMKRRAVMINADLSFDSKIDKGTTLTLKIDKEG